MAHPVHVDVEEDVPLAVGDRHSGGPPATTPATATAASGTAKPCHGGGGHRCRPCRPGSARCTHHGVHRLAVLGVAGHPSRSAAGRQRVIEAPGHRRRRRPPPHASPTSPERSTVATPMPRAAPVTTATELADDGPERPTGRHRRHQVCGHARRAGLALHGRRTRRIPQHAVGRYRSRPPRHGDGAARVPKGSVQRTSARSSRTTEGSMANMSEVSVRPGMGGRRPAWRRRATPSTSSPIGERSVAPGGG